MEGCRGKDYTQNLLENVSEEVVIDKVRGGKPTLASKTHRHNTLQGRFTSILFTLVVTLGVCVIFIGMEEDVIQNIIIYYEIYLIKSFDSLFLIRLKV